MGIGSRFIEYLKPSPPRHMSRVVQLTNYLGSKIEEGTRRASFTNPDTNGVRLLRQILEICDLDTLLALSVKPGRLGEYLLSMTYELEKVIDVRIGKNTSQSLFINGKTRCYELVTPSRRKNPLSEIPLGSKYDSGDWDKIRPLRIWDMGVSNLTFRFNDGRLDYNHHCPSYAIYSLDCFALVAKFIAYYKSQTKNIDLDSVMVNYIYSEIIVPSLLSDSVSIWLRNIYRQQFLSDTKLESHNSTLWDNTNIVALGTEFNNAMYDINHLKVDLRKEVITYSEVLSSLPLTGDGQHFISYYKELYNTTQLSDQQPYIWVEFIKNVSWFEFVLLVSSFSPSIPNVTSFQRDLIREVRFAIMMKPWNEVRASIPLKNVILHRLEGMYAYLNRL